MLPTDHGSKIVDEFALVFGKMLVEIAAEMDPGDLDYWGSHPRELRKVLRSAANIGERYRKESGATPVSSYAIELPSLPPPTLAEAQDPHTFIVRIEDNHSFTDARILTAAWSFDWCEFMDWEAPHPAVAGAFGYQHLKYIFDRRDGDAMWKLFAGAYHRERIVFPGTRGWNSSGTEYMPLLNCVDRIIQWRVVTDETVPQWVAVG